MYGLRDVQVWSKIEAWHMHTLTHTLAFKGEEEEEGEEGEEYGQEYRESEKGELV